MAAPSPSRRALLIGAPLALAFPGETGAAPAAPPRPMVVLELFTSQGCSSCPPADALLARLAEAPGILALSRNVAYWDRLGWPDTLARKDHTALQRAYAAAFGERSVYTPQIVVDGAEGAVGSRADDVDALIRTARARPAGAVITLEAPGRVAVRFAPGIKGPAQVRLIDVSPLETVRIGAGENGGRRISYANVVRSDEVLATLQDDPLALTLPADPAAPQRRALIIQAGQGGPIHAAAWI